jgi:hypothetical protein
MKSLLLKLFLTCLLLQISSQSIFAQVKLGDNVNSINAASLLELESTTKGVLFTRMNSTQMTALSTVKGMVVFNTDSNCLCNYNGSSWINLCRTTSNEWNRSGNSIGSSTSSFLGTTNNIDLVIKTNNAERLRIDSTTGNVGLNNRNPMTTLNIYGGLSIGKCDSVTISSDNQNITVGNNSCIFLNSDNGTSTNRTFSLSDGLVMGQILVLVNIDRDNNDDMELLDNVNTKLNGTWQPNKDDTIILMWNGFDWIELSESQN